MSALSSIHVLLVDDNPNMRAIVAAMLKSVGVGRLSEAEDGVVALELLRREAIDIAIVDFRMKPMDGAAFTRAVRSEGDSANPYLPVIMMTGHSEKSRVTEARDGFAVLDCDGLTVTGRMGHEVRRGDEATAICRLERLSLGSPGEPDCIEMDRATTMFLGEKWENVYRTGPHSLRVLTDGPVPEGRALVRIPRDSVWVF